MQGDGSTTEPGGIMEVVMLGFDLAWVYVVLVLGNLVLVVSNKGGGHHMQYRHTHGLGIGLRKLH